MLAGFFGGPLGLILVLVLAKGKKTKSGAIIGLAAWSLLGALFSILISLFAMRATPTSTPGPVSVPPAISAQ